MARLLWQRTTFVQSFKCGVLTQSCWLVEDNKNTIFRGITRFRYDLEKHRVLNGKWNGSWEYVHVMVLLHDGYVQLLGNKIVASTQFYWNWLPSNKCGWCWQVRFLLLAFIVSLNSRALIVESKSYSINTIVYDVETSQERNYFARQLGLPILVDDLVALGSSTTLTSNKTSNSTS